VVRIWILFASILLLAGSARADWIRDFRADATYDDNLSNSNREADERDDFFLTGHASFGGFGELTDNLRLTMTADLDAQAFASYRALQQPDDRFDGCVALSLRPRCDRS
jgi:hypothetical protein